MYVPISNVCFLFSPSSLLPHETLSAVVAPPCPASVYSGSENYIRISRKYTITWSCTFNFFYYPFNIDYCYMVFRFKRNTDNYVVLQKYGHGILYQESTLTEYSVGRMHVEPYVSQEPYSGLRVVVQLKHLYASEVLTIFIPTTVINLISYATFFFKWYDFNNCVMVSLTTLLVLMTLFSQVSDALPKTSYFKLVDIWFFASILFTFIIIVCHTIVEYHHKYDHEIEAEERERLFLRMNFISGKEEDKRKQFESPPEPHPVLLRLNQCLPCTVLPEAEVSHVDKRRIRTATQHDPNALAMKISHWCKWLTVLFYIVLNIAFWSIAFEEQISEVIKDVQFVELQNFLDDDDDSVTGYP